MTQKYNEQKRKMHMVYTPIDLFNVEFLCHHALIAKADRLTKDWSKVTCEHCLRNKKEMENKE